MMPFLNFPPLPWFSITRLNLFSPWRSRHGWSNDTEQTGRRTQTRAHTGGQSRQHLREDSIRGERLQGGRGWSKVSTSGDQELPAISFPCLLYDHETFALSLVGLWVSRVPTGLALTIWYQSMVFILVQLDESGVPAAVSCTEAAGGLCLPGWGQQGEEAFIFRRRERAARSGGR